MKQTNPDARWSTFLFFAFLLFLGSAMPAKAQVDDFCTEFGSTPSLSSPFARIPYVYGKITHKSLTEKNKIPPIIVTLIDGDQTNKRITIGRSGNYCFRRSGGSGTLIVEINGMEAARRTLASFGATQQREDFDIEDVSKTCGPCVVTKFSQPPSEKTTELYKKAALAEASKNQEEVIRTLKEIVTADPSDFIAFAKLGSLYLEKKMPKEAEAALRKSIELRLDYTPAWTNFGLLRMQLKQYEAAVEVFKHVLTLEPNSARGYQLLGEAYLQSKQGSLGADALNQAIKLDPECMAELHLQLAHLYQLAGAKPMASKEYRLFLEKVPAHPDRAKFEKFIKENP